MIINKNHNSNNNNNQLKMAGGLKSGTAMAVLAVPVAPALLIRKP